MDIEWRRDAVTRRLMPILFRDKTYAALVAPVDDAIIILITEKVSETVINFIANVDFAFDIIDHLLTDPYDAMAVVDINEKLAFMSPAHEKFFGLEPGQAWGKNVRDVIENSGLPHVIKTGIAEVGHIHRMNGKERVVTRQPIRHKGEIVGAIGRVMFKGPQQVEALARRINALESEIAFYKTTVKEENRGERFLDAIIGDSFVIKSVREQIRKVAPLDIPVLIRGESGTGKELVAQALHMMSPRQDGRLVTVNAAALPASLVESELFGYEAGSFTGADRKGRAGKFELADRGTIFLDEIGDMPLEVQSKLLRVLQDRIVERVGSDKPKHVDFRLCSATNRDLEEFVTEGRFRLDLFYRISPVCISLPSLEERIEDIPLLLRHFLLDLARQYHRAVPEISLEVQEYLMSRQWPGNVRQLRHEVERAFVFCENNQLTVADFGKVEATGVPTAAVPRHHPQPAGDETTGALRQAVDRVEAEMIASAMARFNGNKKKVAEHLGVSRSYLYKKLGL
ncbi:sigma-54-dependent Fis family transcriptional regulator [Falsochrobactrum shanghaiense]|uniref:Sigma-54-dependent Fis family transcriptional regulator n=2 Tax=Falsochrobactrum shanghaiense TaxID=2201899 RepID=A0A316J5D1_9HYPH|nr:sigma-54-dependent Fis family transcriptional regulator [Falsochrobactrum shanghaiense]